MHVDDMSHNGIEVSIQSWFVCHGERMIDACECELVGTCVPEVMGVEWPHCPSCQDR